MTFLWSTQALLSATGGRPLGNLPEGVTGISIDTRTLKRGEAFFAIKGERFDGHDFATAAMVAEAGLMVISEAKLPALGRFGVPKVVVPDVQKAMEDLARAARERSRAKVIAITGSAGKTTTKQMLSHMLGSVGTVHSADRSFNNHWGVPLTLARMPADCEYAVFEIGMNHAGEITPLTKMVRPHIAVVTMIAAAHLGHFKSLDDIAAAKGEIFAGVEPGGHALINRDDQRWKILSKMAGEAGIKSIWGYGENGRAQFKLVDWQPGDEDSSVTMKVAGQDMECRLGAPGRHMVQNALAAVGAGYLAGADASKLLLALGDIKPGEGRGRRHHLQHGAGSFTLIDESYNANPASVRAAMQLLANTAVTGEGRRIAVLGDMLELGDHSERLHAALADIIAETNIDMLLLGGSEIKVLAENPPSGPRVEYREDVEELQPLLQETIRAGDVVMIKSSKAIGLSRLVDSLKNRYPAAREPVGA